MNDLISISKSKKIDGSVYSGHGCCFAASFWLFIITHTEHECIGEDCPVCTQMESCEHEIRLLTQAVGMGDVAYLCLYINRNNHSFISGRTRIMSGVFSQLKNPFK